jgi:hypothetical protein
MAALQLPVVLTKLSYLIDNPWAVSLDRAWSAGQILADSLIERNLGTRPITLVGYSIGSRVIFSCLLELARKGAHGIIQNAYMFGSPMVVKHEEFLRARTVVSGRMVNGYNRNDWILGYLFRLTNGGIRRVAGLAAVEDIVGLENMDLTDEVVGHMDYRTAMPRLLRKCEWLVESDEFTEIEDPDPENHGERQRELINEIEEARKELEKEGKPKSAFAFWSRKKKTQKAEWEIYEDSARAAAAAAAAAAGGGRTEDKFGNNHGVLFDVDAIRAELAKEKLDAGDEHVLEIREIQSTLPPMKLDLTPTPSPGLSPRTPRMPMNPRDSLRETQSADAAVGLGMRLSGEHRLPTDSRLSGEKTPTRAAAPHSRKPSAQFHYVETDDGTSMTFDTEESAPPPPPPPYKPKEEEQEEAPPPPPPPKDEPAPARPGVPHSQTVPNIMLNNAWADDVDDPEFGKEKEEMSMTFA